MFLKNKLFQLILVCFVCLRSHAQQAEQQVGVLIDQWHRQAAEANLSAYFALMDSSFVFLGTAPGERWTKQEFELFCRPYFEKKSTWDFKPKDRHISFSADQKIAWFDENLDTWMRGCRGSGVLTLTPSGWKLNQYNLTVLIENEKIEEFIRLRDK